jgi:dynein heavy chain
VHRCPELFQCVQVSADQQEAETVKVVVAAEEKEIGIMQQHTQAIAEEAKMDLAEAMPALQAAIDSLKALNKNDIVEVSNCDLSCSDCGDRECQ